VKAFCNALCFSALIWIANQPLLIAMWTSSPIQSIAFLPLWKCAFFAKSRINHFNQIPIAKRLGLLAFSMAVAIVERNQQSLEIRWILMLESKVFDRGCGAAASPWHTSPHRRDKIPNCALIPATECELFGAPWLARNSLLLQRKRMKVD
jgi:hypothetical protein